MSNVNLEDTSAFAVGSAIIIEERRPQWWRLWKLWQWWRRRRRSIRNPLIITEVHPEYGVVVVDRCQNTNTTDQ